MSKLSTFTDNFSSALSGSWAVNGTAVTTNGILDISTAGDSHSVTTTYDATSDQTYVRVVRVAIGVNTPVTNMVLSSSTSGTNVRISYYRSSQKISFESQTGFADGSPVQIPYDQIQHQWWRIREASSVTYFETSPDCINWIIQRSITSPSYMNSVQLYLSVDNTPQQSAKFDNLNTLPSATYANWFVRKGGADTNGGSSSSLTPDRSGTDMSVTNASTQVTSASGAFTSGDVGKGITIATVHYRIATYTNSTTIQLDRVYAGTTGSSKAWAIGGALATINTVTNVAVTSVWQAGDTVWIGAGVYRELLTMGQSYAGLQLNLVGDVDGAKTGDAGEVQVTGYLTNNTTAPTGSPLIGTPKSFWSFSNIVFVPGTTTCVAWADATDITMYRCAIITTTGTSTSGQVSNVFTTASAHNILYDSCYFFRINSSTYSITLPTSTTADYDANVYYKNNVNISFGSIAGWTLATSGANSFKGGGVYFYNNTVMSNAIPITAAGVTTISIALPITVQNNLLISPGVILSVGSPAGQMIEDYNILVGSTSTPRTTVAAGTHSVSDSSKSALLSLGHEWIWGGIPKPFGMPSVGSGLIGSVGTSGTGALNDITGYLRPAAALQATGAFERSNTWVKETGTVRNGLNALSVTGPGYQEFSCPVDATSTTISVYLRYDSTYAGTLPQLQIINGTECGVANQTVTLTGSANTWTQISVTFTPTSKGIVTVRLVSLSTASAGKVFADDFSVS